MYELSKLSNVFMEVQWVLHFFTELVTLMNPHLLESFEPYKTSQI